MAQSHKTIQKYAEIMQEEIWYNQLPLWRKIAYHSGLSKDISKQGFIGFLIIITTLTTLIIYTQF